MAWDGDAAKKQIFSGDRLDSEGNPIKSKCAKYFLKVDGDGTEKGNYHYPIGTPSKSPQRDALISAYIYAKQYDPELIAKIKSLAKSSGITFPAISTNCHICDKSDIILNAKTVKVPMILMRTGTFNNLDKVPEELEEAARKFAYRPITIKDDDSLGHPPGGIATNKTKNIGEVIDPIWRPETGDIFGYGLFDVDKTPKKLLDRLIKADPTLGLSAAYYADIDGTIERNYIIDNVSILEGETAACEPPFCGPNLNSSIEILKEDTGGKIMTEEVIKLNEKILSENIDLKVELKEKDAQIVKLNEKISEFESQIDTLRESFETDKTALLTEKDGIIAEKDTQIAELTEKIAEVEKAKKVADFRSRFPEDVSEEKFKELLDAYILDPNSIIENVKLNEKYIKLVSPKKIENIAKGDQFTGDLHQNEKDEDADVDDIEDFKKTMNVYVVK